MLFVVAVWWFFFVVAGSAFCVTIIRSRSMSLSMLECWNWKQCSNLFNLPCVCSTSVIGEASCTSFLSTVQAIICTACTRMRSTQLASEKNRCLLNFKVFSMVFGGEQSKLVHEYPRWSEMYVPVGLYAISRSGIGVSFACRGQTRTDPERNPSTLKHHCWVAKLGW